MFTWKITAPDPLSWGIILMWGRMNRFVLDTLPCLTWLFCDKLLTFARGSEDICGNVNRGTPMVQGKKK